MGSVMVNWEREPGERVEDFAAAYLLMRAGRGNQIRPSRGDRGIDVQIPTANGWKIFQVKRFAKNLSSTDKKHIKGSWDRFVKEVLPTRDIKSWSLVLPLEPTPENEIWFAKLTADVDFEINWIGRALLDGWAAENPKLTAYYFQGGETRLHDLMATALSGSQQPQGEGDPLLNSVQGRMLALGKSLDEVDPFYSYELELRSGDLRDISAKQSMTQFERPGLVESVLEQVNDTQYLVTHIIARSEVSTELRPIRGTINFTVMTPEAKEAVERWVQYGAPLSDAPGTVIRTEGPPGTTFGESTVATASVLPALDDSQLPPLEFRLIDPAGVTLLTVPVTTATHSAGLRGKGVWLQVEVGPAVVVEYFVGSEKPGSIQIKANNAVGASPSAAFPAVKLLAQLPGNSLQLAIQGGPLYMPTFDFEDNEISTDAVNFATLLRLLSVVQQHTLSRVTIPGPEKWTDQGAQRLGRVAALLEGHKLSTRFSSWSVPDEEFFVAWDESHRPLIVEIPIAVKLGDTVYDTDMKERQHFESVWLDRSTRPPTVRPGSSDLIWSIAVARTAEPEA